MKKYFNLFSSFTKNNLIREMEYRENFIFWIVIQAIYIGLHLLTINIYFSFTDSLAGWSKAEVYFVVGLFRIIEGLFHTIFHPNILRISEFVKRGDLDFALTKPINSLFLLGTRYQRLDEISTIMGGVGVLLYLSLSNQVIFSSSLVTGIIIFTFFGLVALYSLMMIFATLSIFVTRLTSIWVYWDILSKTLRFPLDVYTNKNPIVNGILWPFLIVVTLPSQIVLGKVPINFLAVELVAPIIMLVFTSMFWKFSLRHYSSASS